VKKKYKLCKFEAAAGAEFHI